LSSTFDDSRRRAARAGASAPALFPELALERVEPTRPARRGARPLLARAALYARVALDLPVRCEYSYAVPPELEALARPGMRALVPFAARRAVGVITSVGPEPGVAAERLRALSELLDAEPVVDASLLELGNWIARTYACSWGEALGALLPAPLKRARGGRRVLVARALPGIGSGELAAIETQHPQQHRALRTLVELAAPIELRELTRRLNLSDSPLRALAKRGWIALERAEKESDELLAAAPTGRTRPAALTEDQERALAAIEQRLRAREHASFLLHGVTGSGKTEVYLRAIETALALGRGAIVLVPEISLTPQTVGWFRSRFGQVAVLHSRMTDAQRLRMWRAARSGEARVVVGARSAVFAPLPDLGVIVVDEEHEPSFKQGSAPRYHAREVALERARRAQAVCILGSATPSLESHLLAQRGVHQRLELPRRVNGSALPSVEVVDMRVARTDARSGGLFSERLAQQLEGVLERSEQAILFLNRRGFAPVLWCAGCRASVRCAQCDQALSWHRGIGRLVCHGCCEERSLPGACPQCARPGLRQVGAGSERVEGALAALAPRARVARMDSDTMLRREDYERTLARFAQRELDVLVGTQMIAKGLDFPGVTLVGVIAAEGGLYMPDFRASERSFQLLAQVAGRAGRGELAGRIVVQTSAPDHPAVTCAAAHDYAGFAREELELRAELGYPPYGRLVRALFEDEQAERAEAEARACAARLRERLAGLELSVLGPAPAPIALLRGRARWHLLVKASAQGEVLERARDALIEFGDEGLRSRYSIDVDPASLL
jgi:primosomal protein N' (replication factor Y)